MTVAQQPASSSPVNMKISSKLTKNDTLVNVFDNEDHQTQGSLSEVFQKRIRALRKRLIEKYEACDVDTLNKDQLEAVSKKDQVVFTLNELEEMLNQTRSFEQTQAEKEAKIQREMESEMQAKLADERVKAEEEKAKHLQALMELFFGLNYLLPNRLDASVVISDSEFSALAFFRAVVTGVGLEMVEDVGVFSVNAQECLSKYFACSEEEFIGGINYKKMHQVVDRILNPAPSPKFLIREELSSAEQLDTASTTKVTSTEYIAVKSTINFINPSEVLVDTYQQKPITDALAVQEGDVKSAKAKKSLSQEKPRTKNRARSQHATIKHEKHAAEQDSLRVSDEAHTMTKPKITIKKNNINITKSSIPKKDNPQVAKNIESKKILVKKSTSKPVTA